MLVNEMPAYKEANRLHEKSSHHFKEPVLSMHGTADNGEPDSV